MSIDTFREAKQEQILAMKERAQQFQNNPDSDNDKEDEDEAEKLPVIPMEEVTDSELSALVSSLNEEQREIFEIVMERISEKERGSSSEKNLFVSGVGEYNICCLKDKAEQRAVICPVMLLFPAGVGKSHVIRVLCAAITKKYGHSDGNAPSCLLAAPTGIAAVKINGTTLHSLLCIEVEHGRVRSI